MAGTIKKSTYLYDYIDTSSFYHNHIAPAVRSRVNIPFHLRDPSLDAAFLMKPNKLGCCF